MLGRARERVGRALVKTALYRVLMVIVTILVAFAVTREVRASVDIGVAANLVKTVAYYGYERLWARVQWGVED